MMLALSMDRFSYLSAVAASALLSVAAPLSAQPGMLLGYTATTPAAWTPRTPSSSMRLAEFVVAPPASTTAGAAGAEVVVYFFGPGQGGSPDANLARWKSQFSNPSGAAVFERVSRDSTPVAKLTIAEYRGTYARGMGAGSAPEAALANNTLVAVVAETPRGTLFFQLFGPQAAVESARAAYMTYIRSVR